MVSQPVPFLDLSAIKARQQKTWATGDYSLIGTTLVIIAEQKSMIGFAGPRVIEQTIKQQLPEGFQRAEFLLEHGMIDAIVERKHLKETLSTLLSHM